jgi:hypothetical protein
MGDLGHPYIFIAMLASVGQYLFIFIFTYRYFKFNRFFDNLFHLNMCNLLVQVFQTDPGTSISLPMTVWLTTHLTRRRSRRLMSSTYFRGFHIVLLADESDESRSGCWDLRYPIWCSTRVMVRHSWSVHPSVRDAATDRRQTRAPSPWYTADRHI